MHLVSIRDNYLLKCTTWVKAKTRKALSDLPSNREKEIAFVFSCVSIWFQMYLSGKLLGKPPIHFHFCGVVIINFGFMIKE